MTKSDAALLERLAGDLDAGYPAFVRAHADAVYATALRLAVSHADAEDIAQETFVRAYRALRRFDAGRVRSLRARPWLLSITLNLWRNALRRAGRHPEAPSTHAAVSVPDTSPGPDAAAESSDDARYLTGLLRALPEHQRVPVVLRHIAGLSHEDIARALECPVGTAKSNVSRGLARLRELARGAPSDPCSPSGPLDAARPSAPRPTRRRRQTQEAR